MEIINKAELNYEDRMIFNLPDIFVVESKIEKRILSLWKRVCCVDYRDVSVALYRDRDVFMVFVPSENDIRVTCIDRDMKIEHVFGLESADIKPVFEMSVEKIAIKY